MPFHSASIAACSALGEAPGILPTTSMLEAMPPIRNGMAPASEVIPLRSGANHGVGLPQREEREVLMGLKRRIHTSVVVRK